MKTIAVVNRRGGVGKTATAHALGAGLALKGYKILFVDLDSQCNLSYDVGGKIAPPTSMEVLSGTASAQEAIQHTAGGDIISASPSLADRQDTQGGAPLFTSLSNNSKGARISTRSISGTIKTSLKNAGYDSDRLTAHSLRHTAVTLSLIGGQKLEEVQQFARHKNIATTLIYAHNLDRMKNQCENTIANAIF